MFYIIITVAIIWYIFDRLCGIPWVSSIQKKCVFITGCDSGFGNALARSLYAKGVYVFAGCYTQQGARKLSEDTGERLRTVLLDVTKSESIKQAKQFVEKNIPPNIEFWGLVNNAGIGTLGAPIEFVSRDELRQVMEVNCFGMIEMVQVFLPLLKQSKGRIVNMSSAVGQFVHPEGHSYLISKHGLRAFSEALRYEKSIWGIKVATVYPGVFRTEIVNTEVMRRGFSNNFENLDPSIREEYGEEYCEKRMESICSMVETQGEQNLSPVINSLEHALLAKYPRPRYYPGTGTWMAVMVAHWCPQFLADFVQDYMLRMNPPAALKK